MKRGKHEFTREKDSMTAAVTVGILIIDAMSFMVEVLTLVEYLSSS